MNTSTIFDHSPNKPSAASLPLLCPEPLTLRPELGPLRPELGPLRPELGPLRPELGAAPAIRQGGQFLDWHEVPEELQARLTRIAEPVFQRERVSPATMRATVLQLCEGIHLGSRVLAHLLNRNAGHLYKRVIGPMIESGALKTAYTSSNDPRQAYTSADQPSHPASE